MRARIAIGFALLLAAVTQAAEPPAPVVPAEKPAVATPAPKSTLAATRPPLKLGIGNVRNYMMPNEFRAAVNGSDADKSTIVVEGEREAPPLKSEQPQPVGLGAVYSLFRHPTNAWRLFVPDPRAAPPGPPDVVPAREFRWGP